MSAVTIRTDPMERPPTAPYVVLASPETAFWRQLSGGSATWQAANHAETVWQGLLSGARILVSAVRCDDVHYALARARGEGETARPISSLRREVLERTARGDPPR
jgi:hypothetical protein